MADPARAIPTPARNRSSGTSLPPRTLDSSARPKRRPGGRQNEGRSAVFTPAEVCRACSPCHLIQPRNLKVVTMPSLAFSIPITAVVYRDSNAAARLLDCAASALADAGHICAGFVQKDEARAGRHRCDMSLVDIASGASIPISEDRGPGARGCQLDPDGLLTAMERALAGLSAETSIVIVNKFGKSEAEGGGFRPLIERALEFGVPVLIAVPWRNIESWRQFAGELARELDAATISTMHGASLLTQLGFTHETGGICSGAADCGQGASMA
ncbi:MAG: DUF2478 domain-containing protein [Hyphomicrobiaceae bacterium]